MKRLFAFCVLTLASAGCTQSRGALMRGASDPPSPVALVPAPAGTDVVTQSRGAVGVSHDLNATSPGPEVSVPLVAQMTE